LKTRRAQIGRLAGEAVLIVVSVYVAIVLEGMSSDRERRASALESLRIVRADLQAELQLARTYAEDKRERTVLFARLSRWLTSDAAIPADSFDVALEGVLTGNVTAFPRRASWTTMVSQGQLEFVGDAELVGRLADLYERWADRIVYNGAGYDEALWTVTRNSVPSIWDRRAKRFLRADRAARLALDGQLVHLELWNDSYGVLLDRWADEIERTLAAVDGHLERRRGGARPRSSPRATPPVG
jgi:hypothetical protein